MFGQTVAILRAQWQSMWRFRPGEGLGARVLGALPALVWYAVWVSASAAAAVYSAGLSRQDLAEFVLPGGFLLVTLYWQLAPVFTGSLGAALELKKLLAYPVPERRWFLIEVLLRLTTGMEMLLVVAGTAAGLLRNPNVPFWGPPGALAVFTLFNLLLAAGLRNLLDRALAFRRIRELLVFALVLATALPQFLATSGLSPALRRYLAMAPLGIWPWTATARWAAGESVPLALLILLTWTLAAFCFAKWQFRERLLFDADAATARPAGAAKTSWTDAWFRLPGLFLPDPLAALVEKELRSLVRTPRFRLLFLMGFSFGLLIWVPMLRRGGPLPADFPAIVGAYSMVLLSEVAFWNVFAFDRSAVRFYCAAPVSFSRVLAAKNVVTVIVVLLEVTAVMSVCLLLRLPLRPAKVLEAYAVVLVLCIYLLSLGNLNSVYRPRPVNPEQSWGSSAAAKSNILLVLLYPLVASPVLLAYLARFAFDSDAAFYGVLGLVGALGLIVHRVASDTALQAAEQRREVFLAALSESSGPLSAS